MKHNKVHLKEQIVDTIVAFKFLKLMTQDFDKTDAFKLGIIDKDGKVLKKRKDLKRGAEKDAYTIFHTLVWNIKKILKKIPLMKSKLGSYVASLFLLKEAIDMKYGTGNGDKTVELILDYLEKQGIKNDTDTLFESRFDDALGRGIYVATREMISPSYSVINPGDKIIVNESDFAFTHFLGVPLYKAIHEDTGEEIVIDRGSISSPETFAGNTIFDVDNDEYHKTGYGRQKYERWSKKLDMNKPENQSIKKYHHSGKGRNKSILVRNKTTGEMKYLTKGDK